MNRRTFVKLVGATALAGISSPSLASRQHKVNDKIDREGLVRRHKITITQPDPLTPLTVGNGEFAFTADITGMQSFPEFHMSGMLIQTMSQWAWHTAPNPNNYQLSDTFNMYDSHGQQVPYPSGTETGGGFGDTSPTASWLNSNPHKFDLGRIALMLPDTDNRPAQVGDLVSTSQELDLWTGLLISQFVIAGQSVTVMTVAHPTLDLVAFSIHSPLVASAQLGVKLAFSYPSGAWLQPADWEQPDKHTTLASKTDSEYQFWRKLDDGTQYICRATVTDAAVYTQSAAHEFFWNNEGQSCIEIVVGFAPENGDNVTSKLPSFDQVKQISAGHWEKFWLTGGAIDLSASTDPRWLELERRIVLSQYQTAVNSAGSLPPQETGLVQNSWFGKFHHEMYWWHAAHFTLWGREELLMRSLNYYRRVLPVARETARRVGCRGARWPKMVGPEGRESPNRINPFLTWQQPHPIHFAELMYQARPNGKILEFFKDIVFESAEFMASFAWWNSETSSFDIGPPSVAPYENNFPDRRISKNPTFDLAYWSWSLGIAQLWKQRLGLEPEQDWENVRKNLSPLTVVDGIYRETEEVDVGLSGHPTMLAAFGVVPKTDKVDPETMQSTLNFVLTKWPPGDTWGWDYAMMAMAAARLGRPDQAIEALLVDTQKNRYLLNGHNYQQDILPLYLPGNGGLLFVTAMMAAGWNGAPSAHAPGFPTPDEGWTVKWEGLRPAL